MIKTFKIDKYLNLRLDKYLKLKYTNLTQSFIEKNIRKKNILINNKKTAAKYILKIDDEVKILNFHPENYKNKINFKKNKFISNRILDKFNQSIVFQNNYFIILDKWSTIATQGGSKINISIDDIIKKISNDYRLVHRLDKETSGLLIIAKNLEYSKIFGALFKQKNINKSYIAICEGKPKLSESIIKLDIRNKNSKIDETQTYFKLLQYKNGISQILFKPITGKTHQLRIVSKNLGCPIVGDNKYNAQSKYNNFNLKLNAYRIEFFINKKKYQFLSKLPLEFINFIKEQRLNSINKYKIN